MRGDDYLTLLGSMFRAEQAERNWRWLSANVDVLLDKAPTFERNVVMYAAASYCAPSAPMRWPRCSSLVSVVSTAGVGRSISAGTHQPMCGVSGKVR
jgi:hypothetical protein